MRKLIFYIVLSISALSVFAKNFNINKIKNKASYSKFRCQIAPHCDNNINPFWAKIQYGADLAEEEIKKLIDEKGGDISPEVFSNTAVIDSGFDGRSQLGSLMVTPQLLKGYPEAGNEKIDPDGHGTAVSGMIAGKGVGFTKYVNLNIYRITKKFAGGSISSKNLTTSILNACKTSEIVNVSWGSSADETGRDNPKDEKWYKRAQELGCLIVKSSGNGGFKRYKSYNLPIDAPIILVSSTNSFGKESSFSSQGDIYGPGENVYTLKSHQSKIGIWGKDKYCRVNGAVMGPISGTSFSSPSVAAVFTQVLTVLKIRGLVPKDPKSKIILLKKIILAAGKWAKQNGDKYTMANSYYAVLIAKNISSANSNVSLDDLINVGKQTAGSFCQKSYRSCNDISKCSSKKSCVHEQRKRLYLCEEHKYESTLDLLKTFQDLKEKELLSYMSSRVKKGDYEDGIILDLLEESWDTNIKDGRIIDGDLAIDIFERAKNLGLGSFISTKKFLKVLKDSYSISGIDSRGDSEFEKLIQKIYGIKEKDKRDYGVVTYHDLRVMKVVELFSSFSVVEQIKILNKLPEKRYSFTAALPNVQSGFFTLLIQHKEQLQPSVRLILKKRVKALSAIFAKDLRKEGSFVSEINEDKVKILSEYYPRFFERFKKQMKKPYLTNGKNAVRFLLNYSKEIFNISANELALHLLDEVVDKLEFLESVNLKSSKSVKKIANEVYIKVNSTLPLILEEVVEKNKVFNLDTFNKIKRVLLSDLPLNTGKGVIHFSNLISSPYQKMIYHDLDFIRKYLLNLHNQYIKIYRFEGYIFKDSYKFVNESLREALSDVYWRVKFKNNLDVKYLEKIIYETLEVASSVYPLARQGDKIKSRHLGLLGKYIFSRGKNIERLKNIKEHGVYMAIYASSGIYAMLKFIKKVDHLEVTDDYEKVLKKLKTELLRSDSKLSSNEIRKLINKEIGLNE